MSLYGLNMESGWIGVLKLSDEILEAGDSRNSTDLGHSPTETKKGIEQFKCKNMIVSKTITYIPYIKCKGS